MNGENARCPVHNLTLDPQGECVLCRRTAQKPGQPGTTKTFIGLLVITVMTLGAWSLFGKSGGKRSGNQPRSAGVLAAGVDPDELSADDFLGTWTSTSCAGTFYTTFHANGTYSGHLIRKKNSERVQFPEGTWELRNGSLVWVHGFDTSRTKKGEEDINEILTFNKDSFTLRETNGKRTTFHREQ